MSTATSSFAPVPCSRCCEWKNCGGLPGDQNLFGCMDRCISINKCQSDWVCPCRQEQFIRALQEVGGFEVGPEISLMGMRSEPPQYVPKVHHGYGRGGDLSRDFVAISTFSVLGRLTRGYSARFDSPESFRAGLRVRHDAQVLLLSVAKDAFLEPYWAHYKTAPAALAKLKLAGVTVPNFSFFNDAPRFHTMYNRKRMILAAEQLSAAGVPVVPHLNAETDADWDFWRKILGDRPHLRYVVKEFRTGKLSPQKGEAAIKDLRRLQDQLGRPLHPILVGAGQYTEIAATAFRSFTLVDSNPTMKAVKRRKLSFPAGEARERRVRTEPGATLDRLFDANVRAYGARIEQRVAAARERASPQLCLFPPAAAPPAAGAPSEASRPPPSGRLPLFG